MTKSQAKLYKFIKNYIKKHGYAPTYNEMAKGVNVKSKSNIHSKLTLLKKVNKIVWTKATARSVEIVEIIDIEH